MKRSAVYRGDDGFDRVFRALGDPHRIKIVRLLREKELSAGEILEKVDVVQSTLSHHMKTLSDSGVVNTLRSGKWSYYSLNEEKLAGAASFLEDCAEGTRIRRGAAGIQDAGNESEPLDKSSDEVPESLEETEESSSGEEDDVREESSGRTWHPPFWDEMDEEDSDEEERPEKASEAGEKSAEKDSVKSAGKNAEKNAGKNSEKSVLKNSEKKAQKNSEKNPEKSGKKKDKKNKKGKKNKKQKMGNHTV